MVKNKKCSYVYPNGLSCRAWCKKGTDRCANHPIVVETYFESEEVGESSDAAAVSNSGHITVDEPESLKVLRADLEKKMPVEAVNQAITALRQLMGLPEIPSVEMAKIIDSRKSVDKTIADEEQARLDLITRSRRIILSTDRIDPAEKAKREAQATEDIQLAAASLAYQKQDAARELANDARETVYGPPQDEVFNYNGVTYLVRAGGMRKIPHIIAEMLRQRMRGYDEAAARKRALSADNNSLLEIGHGLSLERTMAEIDRKYKSKSLLSSATIPAVTDYLVDEEIIQ